jgi:hypothetical protein
VPEILERSMYCKGRRVDGKVHWSANCELLTCCVDERGPEYCYERDNFVCERLDEWAQRDTRYSAALERPRGMREGGEAWFVANKAVLVHDAQPVGHQVGLILWASSSVGLWEFICIMMR